MGYTFIANNKEIGDFALSAFHWPLILDQCGTYFIALSHGARWFYVQDIDERMGDSPEGPAIIFNSGFPITEEESKVLARIVRNYAIIQRSLDPAKEAWIPAIKLNLIDRIEAFAEWAEQSQGFKIY